MRIAYFDCFAGIAGDMTVGALLDAGLELDLLRSELAKLGVSGYDIRRTQARRHHIAGTKFDVLLEHEVPFHTHETDGAGQGGVSDEPHEHGHTHAHSHHEHPGEHAGHAAPHAHGDDGEHVHRKLADVVEIISHAGLSPWVSETAIRVFSRLGEAESRMHGIPVEEVHFHEVGAVDAIIDIVGACIGIESLGVEKVYASPLRVGSGTIRVAHGTMPVPAPATLELLRGVPIEHTDIPFELVTPTGAALITTLAERFGKPPLFIPERVGYGAGGRDPARVANLLRVEIGEAVTADGQDEVVMLETNIDDMTPEVYGYLIERFLGAGAKDVFLVPVIMKKNRPGILLNVLTDEEHRDRLIDMIFRETPTLGVRISAMPRRTLVRESVTVDTPWGPARAKRADWNGEVRVTPEYDDCAAIARNYAVPILRVYEEVRKASLSAGLDKGA